MEPQESNERRMGAEGGDKQMLRFVILRHEPGEVSAGEAVHWDFLVETVAGAEWLPTWRLAAWEEGAFVVEAVRLPDHRRAYLDYEGPISGGRGRVKRVASGVVEILRQTATRWELLLHTNKKILRAVGTASDEDHWMWSFG